MRPKWIVASIVASLAAGAAWWGARSRAQPHETGYQELTEKIRAGLDGTRTRCEVLAPSLEVQREWRRLQEPRKFGRTPLRDLLQQPDVELSSEITSRLLDEVYATGLGAMTEPERNVQLINALQGEVFNGGFHQYFSNSSGDCASRTRAAAKAIHPELSRIFEAAVGHFPNSSPAEDRATRNSQMASLGDEWGAWSKLDSAFYELPMDQVLARYVRLNAARFDSPPQSL